MISPLYDRAAIGPPAVHGMAGQTLFLATGMGRNVAGGTTPIPEKVGPAVRSLKSGLPIMAGRAFPDPRVCAFEKEARLAVVEVPGVERNKLRVRALVLGVTGPAAFGLVPMEAPARLDARGDLFVAGEALSRLGLTAGSMTGGTILSAGLIGVEGAERPWSGGGVRFLGKRRAGSKTARENEREDR